MRQAMKKVVLGALIGAALVSLAGCGGGSAPKTSGVPKDTLVVGLPKDPETGLRTAISPSARITIKTAAPPIR